MGATSERCPVLWEGSTMTGRCDRCWTMATAERSRVLRLAVSNVRMPRSHRMMSRLPEEAAYSAASSHSSIVADRPLFSIRGFPVSEQARSRSKFCMLRAPTRKTSTTSTRASISWGWRTSTTTGRPKRSFCSARMSRPSGPRPWKA
jgi:hypothetical protein